MYVDYLKNLKKLLTNLQLPSTPDKKMSNQEHIFRLKTIYNCMSYLSSDTFLYNELNNKKNIFYNEYKTFYQQQITQLLDPLKETDFNIFVNKNLKDNMIFLLEDIFIGGYYLLY